MQTADLIIPTLNAGNAIGPLLDKLSTQTYNLSKILVVDSSSDDNTVQVAKEHGATVISIPRNQFDHGGTRHKAFLQCSSDFVLFMTQDAMPTSSTYVEELLSPFQDSKVAMVSGRQVPKPDARRFEQLVRQYNYPSETFVRDKSDVSTLGIKAFFASDVCSAYRKSAYMACGGFPYPCNTNEDMLMAARFIQHGYKVAYAGSAEVLHSHNLSLKQEYLRNKAIGKFLKDHREDLMHASEIGEGKKMVISISRQLIAERKITELFAFLLDCASRLLGNWSGKHEKK